MLTDIAGGIGAMVGASKAHESKPKVDPESDLGRILEKGFRAWAEEEQEKKLEELRKKILEKMGLSEEDLSNMSPEQRAAIEDIVAAEIRKRLEALHAEKTEGTDALANTSGTPGTPAAPPAVGLPAAPVAGNVGAAGLGIGAALLSVLSEARDQAAEAQGAGPGRQELPDA